MRVKEMHPLCCVSMESPGVGDRSPEASAFRRGLSSASVGSDCNAWRETGTGINVAGVLYKWTNYSKGWRSRWFLLRNGVLSYSKIRPSEDLDQMWTSDDVRVIGDASTARLSGIDNKGRRKPEKPVGVVHLKISTFRESRSDVQRFYIFTATKTLHLRTNSKKDRVAWINALTSTRNLFSLKPFDDKLCHISANLSVSTEKLRNRLLEGGINEILIQECEQIMRSEISGLHGQFKLLCEERSSLLDTLRQWEAANIEVEAPGLLETQYQLGKDEYPSTEQGKYNEWSTTESSDVIEKLELEELSDVDETLFFDTRDSFSNSSSNHPSKTEVQDVVDKCSTYSEPVDRMHAEAEFINCSYPHIERRKKLPDPAEQEKGVSLWSMIKDNVGKDLTRVCLPVYFNEPISSLQKCCEDMEYSYLLDRAYDCGQKGNNLLRVLNVAAFAVSGYASSEGRHCKPFNPLLGETYEAEYPDKAIRFISEKVCHHPTLIACHCEGKGWKFWGDSNLRTKFWGRSIQLDPVGVLTLEFDDGEIFQWSKVTTNIYNLILGKVYCDHHGTLHIRGNRQHSCKLRFREQSILDRNPHQVQGIVEDVMGRKVASLFGKWDESMYYVHGDWFPKAKGCTPPPDASLLWRRNKPPPDLTRYNLTSFAITLNELTPGLKEKLPPTDSRLRPDQRHLENGEYEKANAEKLRLEKRQRMSTKIQENGWKPKWFQKDSEDGSFRYIGGYWEAREQGKWDGCPYIFGEFTEDVAANTL